MAAVIACRQKLGRVPTLGELEKRTGILRHDVIRLFGNYAAMLKEGGLERLGSGMKAGIDDLLLDLLRGPVKVVAFVIFVHLGLTIFDWSVTAMMYFSKLLILIVAGSLTYVALKVNDLLLDAWRRRTAHEADRKFNDQLFSIIRRSLNIFVVIVAVLVTAQNIGINITAVITSLSIGGLAVGLAAQDTLANLFGAIAVFADKPFRVGDHIKVADTEGTVEKVGMRSFSG